MIIALQLLYQVDVQFGFLFHKLTHGATPLFAHCKLWVNIGVMSQWHICLTLFIFEFSWVSNCRFAYRLLKNVLCFFELSSQVRQITKWSLSTNVWVLWMLVGVSECLDVSGTVIHKPRNSCPAPEFVTPFDRFCRHTNFSAMLIFRRHHLFINDLETSCDWAMLQLKLWHYRWNALWNESHRF